MGVGRGSPTRMDWSWALIWVLASGQLVPGGSGQPHHSASSTSWTVWGSKPISGSLGLKPIFGSWVVRPGSNKPTSTGTRPTGSRPQVGLELNSKWGPMAGTSAYKWSHSRPGSSSYQTVNFSYKMKPKPHPPPYKPPTAVTTKPPPTTPPSTTPPTLPDFLLPSPLLPLEDIDLPSGGAPTVLRPSSRLSPSRKPLDPRRTPQSLFTPPCRPGVAPPCLPPTLSIFLP